MKKMFEGGDTQKGQSKIKGGPDPSPNCVLYKMSFDIGAHSREA